MQSHADDFGKSEKTSSSLIAQSLFIESPSDKAERLRFYDIELKTLLNNGIEETDLQRVIEHIAEGANPNIEADAPHSASKYDANKKVKPPKILHAALNFSTGYEYIPALLVAGANFNVSDPQMQKTYSPLDELLNYFKIFTQQIGSLDNSRQADEKIKEEWIKRIHIGLVLVQHRCDQVNKRLNNGNTLLHEAILNKLWGVADDLLALEADAKLKANDGRSALQIMLDFAAENANSKKLSDIECGKKLEAKIKQELKKAYAFKTLDEYEIEIQRRFTLEFKQAYESELTQFFNPELALKLIRLGADPNTRNKKESLLSLVIRMHPKYIKDFVAAGADLNGITEDSRFRLKDYLEKLKQKDETQYYDLALLNIDAKKKAKDTYYARAKTMAWVGYSLLAPVAKVKAEKSQTSVVDEPVAQNKDSEAHANLQLLRQLIQKYPEVDTYIRTLRIPPQYLQDSNYIFYYADIDTMRKLINKPGAAAYKSADPFPQPLHK